MKYLHLVLILITALITISCEKETSKPPKSTFPYIGDNKPYRTIDCQLGVVCYYFDSKRPSCVTLHSTTGNLPRIINNLCKDI